MVILLSSCHKDPIELQLGTVNLIVTKGYKSNSMSKGIWDSFSADVSILYKGGDSTAYNCVFTDPNGVGIYTNDIVNGERIYLRRGEGFRIMISAEIDGEEVYGDSGQEWIYYSDERGSLDIEIELLAGKTRIGIYQPRNDEIYGSFVIAKGEIVELTENSQLEECGIVCVPKSIYNTFESNADFNLELMTDEWIIGRDESFNPQSNNRKFTVMLMGMVPNTEYYMRAFAFCHGESEEFDYCYSRVVSFTTTDRDSSQLYLINNDVRVFADSAALSARLIMLSGSVEDVETGLCLSTAGSSYGLTVNDAERICPGTIDAGNNGTNGIVSVVADSLTPGTSYKYRFYAVYNNSYYYSGESTFRTTLDPENISVETLDPRNQVETGSSAVLFGELLESAGCNIVERGFKYGFFSVDGTTVPTSVDNLQSSVVGSVLSGGQFSASVTLPITVKRLYYVAYVREESGFVKYGEIKSVNVRPENVPEITISDTVEVTTYSMLLRCNVNTHGYQCRCGVVYAVSEPGTSVVDINYGDPSVNTSSLVNVSGNEITIKIMGLTPGTNYALRAFALVGDEYIESETTMTKYTMNIGDRGPNGGIVFYSGTNYALEAKPVDTVAYVVWGQPGGYAITVETPGGTGMVSGITNTESIIRYNYSYEEPYAAYECYRHGGYLPSTSELMELARYFEENIVEVTTSDGSGFLEAGYYWTSDEYDEDNAVAVHIQPLLGRKGRAPYAENMSKTEQLSFIPIIRF